MIICHIGFFLLNEFQITNFFSECLWNNYCIKIETGMKLFYQKTRQNGSFCPMSADRDVVEERVHIIG